MFLFVLSKQISPDSGGGHDHAIVSAMWNYCAHNIVHLFVESLINNENPVIQIIPPPSLSCGINFGALSDAERLLTWAQANKYKSIWRHWSDYWACPWCQSWWTASPSCLGARTSEPSGARAPGQRGGCVRRWPRWSPRWWLRTSGGRWGCWCWARERSRTGASRSWPAPTQGHPALAARTGCRGQRPPWWCAATSTGSSNSSQGGVRVTKCSRTGLCSLMAVTATPWSK